MLILDFFLDIIRFSPTILFGIILWRKLRGEEVVFSLVCIICFTVGVFVINTVIILLFSLLFSPCPVKPAKGAVTGLVANLL